MSKNTVWFITGAACGMGTDIAKAALAAGYSVVATARDAEKVTEAVGEHGNLLALPLDITDPAAAESAVDAALAR
jgi:NADP-dependent 3-hydroxy acid dehydrogenase YdfG